MPAHRPAVRPETSQARARTALLWLALALPVGFAATTVAADLGLTRHRACIQNLVADAFSILGDTARPQTERRAAFQALVARHFDVPAIGRLVTGPHWDRAGEAERAELVRLLEGYLAESYAEKLTRYARDAVRVGAEQRVGDDVTVASQFAGQAGPISIDWHLVDDAQRCRVADVVVQGVSILKAQRAEFMSLISRGGGDLATLVASLREREARSH